MTSATARTGAEAIQFGEFIGRPDRWARLLMAAALVGMLFGLIGPYNSFAANPTTRLFYWTALFVAGTAILWPSAALATCAGLRRGFPPAFSSTAAIAVASVPLAALAAAGCHMFWPVHASGIRALDWYGQTLLISLPGAVIALRTEGARLFSRHVRDNGASEPEGPDNAAPNTLPRGSTPPPHLLDAALCLEMEDHHVRIHTPGRSHLYLAPLRQVAQQLGSSRGGQVHRSWWVARSAVRGWREDRRSILLVLTNDLEVPVARNRVAELRAKGWLATSAQIRAGG